MMLVLFIPIGITVNLAEKIDKILENEVPFIEVAYYYLDFTIYFANLLFPIFLFLSVIWFTSKLAMNTEIVAFLSSGVSFYRFLRPYLIGATIVCVSALFLAMYLAPQASKGFNEFKYQYLKRGEQTQETNDVYRQINDNEYIYASHFQPKSKSARNFTLEHFEGNELKFKISAANLKYSETLSKKINMNASVIPTARLIPIPPLLLKEATATAIMVKINAEIGILQRL